MTSLIAIAEIASFTKDAAKIFTADELADVIATLAMNPEAGLLIPNSGGARYIRAAAKGHGKARGNRVVYYFGGIEMPLFLIACYFKGQKEKFGPADCKEYLAIVTTLKAEYGK